MKEYQETTLQEEIDRHRKEFERDTEKIIIDSVKESLEKILSEESKRDDSVKKETSLKFWPILVSYLSIIASIIFLVYKWTCKDPKSDNCDWIQMSDNICLIIVSLMILSTLVVCVVGYYYTSMYKFKNESEFANRSKEHSNVGKCVSSKKDFNEKMQDLVLDIVIKDTLNSLKKK